MTQPICKFIIATVLASTVLASSQPCFANENDVKAGNELMQLESAWCAASMKNDQATLAKMEADDFLSIGSNGTISTKQMDLEYFSKTKIAVCEPREMTSRIYGDTGIVTGKVAFATSSYSGVMRFTDVFVKKNDTWQIVSSHGSEIK